MSAILFFTAIFVGFAESQVASGGNYTLTQAAIAGGGASGTVASANGIYKVEGTMGQNAAGTTQQTSPYKFHPGFWNAAVTFAPTAASVNLGGRVMLAGGQGIVNSRVTLTMPDGTSRTVISGSFGYYCFEDVEVGRTYVISATAKRFVFSVPTQVVSLNEAREDVDFIGEPVISQ